MVYQKTIPVYNRLDACACYRVEMSNLEHLEHTWEIGCLLGHSFDEKTVSQGARIDMRYESVWEVWKEANRINDVSCDDKRLRLENCFFTLMDKYCQCVSEGEMFLVELLNYVDALMVDGETYETRFEDEMYSAVRNANNHEFTTAVESFLEVYDFEEWPMLYDAALIVVYSLCKMTNSYQIYLHNSKS